MEQMAVGDLVKVATSGPQIDGIVVDVLSDSKLAVALIDRERGPVVRTVPAKALTARDAAGPDDHALELLARRTRPHQPGAARGGAGVGASRAGHTRAAMHRTTGK